MPPVSHCFRVAQQEFSYDVCSVLPQLPIYLPLSLLKSNTLSSFFHLCLKWLYIPKFPHYLGNFHNYVNSSYACINIFFSPVHLSMLIWLLAQLEGRRETLNIFSPTLSFLHCTFLGRISEFSILSYCSICLFLCREQMVLITIAL